MWRRSVDPTLQGIGRIILNEVTPRGEPTLPEDLQLLVAKLAEAEQRIRAAAGKEKPVQERG
jgi:hypothetical protein